MVNYQPIQTSGLPLSAKVKIEIWQIVQATLFRYSPRRVRKFRNFLLRLFGARISGSASVHNLARIHCPWNLEMDDFASVGEHAWIYSLDTIRIGRYSCVGQHTFLLTGSHDYNDPTFPLVTAPIRIGEGCWLAVGVKVIPGVTIEDYCVVGCGSVVCRDLPRMMVCAGNPCKPLKRRELEAS